MKNDEFLKDLFSIGKKFIETNDNSFDLKDRYDSSTNVCDMLDELADKMYQMNDSLEQAYEDEPSQETDEEDYIKTELKAML